MTQNDQTQMRQQILDLIAELRKALHHNNFTVEPMIDEAAIINQIEELVGQLK